MAEYVDKVKLMSRIESELMRWGESEYNALQILGDIEDFPAADVVEVVRCKDCKRYSTELQMCLRASSIINAKPDDFCSYGERSDT